MAVCLAFSASLVSLIDLEPPLERPHLEVELVDALLDRGRNSFLRCERRMATAGEPAQEGECEHGFLIEIISYFREKTLR